MAIRSNFPNQLLEDALPVLESLIFEEYERYPDYLPMIFRIYETSMWGEQTTTMAGIKAAVEKNEGENVAFDDPIEGFDQTYRPVTFAIATDFSQELVEDDRLNLVEDTYRSLGMSMYQTRQITGFNILNDGFTTAGPDGSSLFNTAHTMIGGHTSANRPSTDIALSVAGLREMEVDMMRQVNHRNINIAIVPRYIIVPPELSQTLYELIKSPERPDTANRAMNTFYPHEYHPIVSPFLTSSTAWFALTDPSQHQLRWYERISPQVQTWQDEASGDINTKIRSRFIPGFSDFIGSWGTTG